MSVGNAFYLVNYAIGLLDEELGRMDPPGNVPMAALVDSYMWARHNMGERRYSPYKTWLQKRQDALRHRAQWRDRSADELASMAGAKAQLAAVRRVSAELVAAGVTSRAKAADMGIKAWLQAVQATAAHNGRGR